MRLPTSTRRTLATVAAFLMLLAGLLLATSKLGDDTSEPAPAPSSSPAAPTPAAPQPTPTAPTI
ncbi:hypothetical protein ABZ612_20420 [Streptomyces avermitilis]|uniref:hypothetical protein n=1 Tax=Streptomyces avermitilis TaxID=33903 RepID=UPI003410BCE4